MCSEVAPVVMKSRGDETCDVFHLDPPKVAVLKTRLLPSSSVTFLAETFLVLGDVTRVRILGALSRSGRCLCDIARPLGLRESAGSASLRSLACLALPPRR